MFITDDDYAVVIGKEAFKAVTQASADTREAAEAEAVEEVFGYLRPVYDCDAIASAKEGTRNRMIIKCVVDIALHNMAASLPQKMASEVRQERYDRAIKWLEGVQAGDITPDLPLKETSGPATPCNTIFYSDPKLRHNW